MPKIDPARFHELVKRRDDAKATLREAESALQSAQESQKSAERNSREAEYNLSDYVNECAGDPKLERLKF